MKNVVHVLPSIYKIDSRVVNETKFLQNHFNITVICYQDKYQDFEDYNFNLIEVEQSKFRLFKLIISLFNYCKQNHVDLIHCHDFVGLICGYFIKILQKKELILIYDSHELWSQAHYKKNLKNFFLRKLSIGLEKIIARKVKNIITVSNSIKNYLSFYFESENIEVVRNIPSYINKIESSYLRDYFSINSSVKIIIYQGLISESRGVFDLLDDFNQCEESKNYSLVYLGYGPDENKLKNLVKYSNNVFVHDKVSQREISKITCSADIGIHPLQNTCLNHEYALPNKLFEYLNSGLLLITTKLNEMHSELSQNEIGFCYNDALELNEILRKLRTDKTLFKSISQNVIRYNSMNNYEKEMAKLKNYYEKLFFS